VYYKGRGGTDDERRRGELGESDSGRTDRTAAVKLARLDGPSWVAKPSPCPELMEERRSSGSDITLQSSLGARLEPLELRGEREPSDKFVRWSTLRAAES